MIQKSPDCRHVVVVYSCGEIDLHKEVGLFALLEEPKDSPRLLLRPRGLTCLVSSTAGRDIYSRKMNKTTGCALSSFIHLRLNYLDIQDNISYN